MQDVKVHCGRIPKFMTRLKSEEKYHAGSGLLSTGGSVCKNRGRDSDFKSRESDAGVQGRQ